MAYIRNKLGDHYDNQQRVELIMEATDTAVDLPTDVPAGSIAYREDRSKYYLFGVSGAWIDVTAKLGSVSGTNTGDQNAAGVSIADMGGYYIQTTVEGALQEAGASLSDIDTRFTAGIASPAGTYVNLAALIAANPDHSKTYITLDDGKWCYYNGSAFVSGGLYQATVASGVTIVDSANHFVATQVEGALNEIGQVDNAVVSNITIPNPVIQTYYGVEGNAPIASTFRGWAHQVNYTSGKISIVMILCRTDIAGAPIKCTIRKLNMSTVLATGYSVSTGTSAWRTFVLDVTLDSTLITESGFFVTVEAVYGAGCKLRADYAAGLVAMNHNTVYHDYYTTTSSASWEDSGASNYPMCVRLGNFDTISLVRGIVEPDGYNVLALPKKVYGVAGKELNIYFDSTSRYDYKKKTFEVDSAYGSQQNERWTYNGALVTGNVAITMYSPMLQYLSTASSALTMVAASAKTGQNPTCLFIGDSLMASGKITGELLNIMSADVMDVTLIGTIGTSPNLHEGISGYSINDFYTGASSPFVYSGAFNFSQYMSAHSFSSVDYVFICLGINDVFGTGFTPDAVDAKWITMKSQLDAMIANIKLFNSSVKIGLMTSPPPAYEQDGFGKNYYSGVSQRSHHRAWHQMICHVLADYDAREAESIYIVPTHVNLDTEHNMQVETVAVNSRNSATIVRQSNGVHPADCGYYQMADTVYYFIKNV